VVEEAIAQTLTLEDHGGGDTCSGMLNIKQFRDKVY